MNVCIITRLLESSQPCVSQQLLNMNTWILSLFQVLYICHASIVNIAMVGDGDKSEWVNNIISNATGLDVPIAMGRTPVVQRYCFPFSCHTVCLYDSPQMDVCKCLLDSTMAGCMKILTNLEEIADGVPGGTIFGKEFKNHEKQVSHTPDVIALLANEVNEEQDTTSSTSCAISLRAKLPNKDIRILSAEAAGSPGQLLIDATPRCQFTESDVDKLEQTLMLKIDSFKRHKSTTEAKQGSSRNRLRYHIRWIIAGSFILLLLCAFINGIVTFSAREWELSEETPFAGKGLKIFLEIKMFTDLIGITTKSITPPITPSSPDQSQDELDATQQVSDCSAGYIQPVTFTDVVSETKILQSDLTMKIASLPKIRNVRNKSKTPFPDGWTEPDITTVYSRGEKPTKTTIKSKPRKTYGFIDTHIIIPLTNKLHEMYITAMTKLLQKIDAMLESMFQLMSAAQRRITKVLLKVEYYCVKIPYRWYRISRGFEVTPQLVPEEPPPPPPPLDEDGEILGENVPPIPLIEIAPPPLFVGEYSHCGEWVMSCAPPSECDHDINISKESLRHIQRHLPHWSCCGIAHRESQCPMEREDASRSLWSKTQRALLLAFRTAGIAKVLGSNARRDLKWKFRILSRKVKHALKQLINILRVILSAIFKGILLTLVAVVKTLLQCLRFTGRQLKACLKEMGFSFSIWYRFKARCKAIPGEVQDFIVNTLLKPPNPFEGYELPIESTKRREENWTCSNSEADTDYSGSLTPWEDNTSCHSRLIGKLHAQMEMHGGTAALLKEVERTIESQNYDDIGESSATNLQLPLSWKRNKNIYPPAPPHQDPVETKVISTQTPHRMVRVKEVDEKRKFTLPDQYQPAFTKKKIDKKVKKDRGPVSKWVKHQLWPFGKNAEDDSDESNQTLLTPCNDEPRVSPYKSFNDGRKEVTNHEKLVGSSIYLPGSARKQQRRCKQRDRFNTLIGGEVPLVPNNRVENILKYRQQDEDYNENHENLNEGEMNADYLSPEHG